MGGEYEVSYYEDGNDKHFDYFDNLVDAIIAMGELRTKKFKCIVLEWRPR